MKKILSSIIAGAVVIGFAAPAAFACPPDSDNVKIVKDDKDADKPKVVEKDKDRDKAKKKKAKNKKKKPA